jgi:DNA invertase Pin-like site-specific DNA recombinase
LYICFQIQLDMKANYIRVSTLDQKTDRQQDVDGIKFIDKCSGSIAFKERPEAKKLIKQVDNGKITEIEVHSIDRLGRNTIDIMNTIQGFTDKGVNLISKKEGLQTIVDGKVNPVAKMMVGILGTLAEFELTRIKERQREGIEKAKKNGNYAQVGRPEGKESIEEFMNKETSKKVYKELKAGHSLRRAAAYAGCSLGTAQKVNRLMKENRI